VWIYNGLWLQVQLSIYYLRSNIPDDRFQGMMTEQSTLWEQTSQKWKSTVSQLHHHTLHDAHHSLDIQQHQTDRLSHVHTRWYQYFLHQTLHTTLQQLHTTFFHYLIYLCQLLHLDILTLTIEGLRERTK